MACVFFDKGKLSQIILSSYRSMLDDNGINTSLKIFLLDLGLYLERHHFREMRFVNGKVRLPQPLYAGTHDQVEIIMFI